jgi:hypothetical protein
LDLFVDVGFGFQQVINLFFVLFVTCSADVLDHIAQKVVQLLISDKIPDFYASSLIVVR